MDLVGNAFALNYFGNENAVKSAKQILNNKNTVSLLAYEVAKNFLHFHNNEPLPAPDLIVPKRDIDFYREIGAIKKNLRTYTRNPIQWMDLAYFYTGIGQNIPAKKCVDIALLLSKDNRYLLRSASRFFVHIGDWDSALHYIRKSDVSKHDPWLISAELAISDIKNFTPKFIKEAKFFLKKQIDPFHLSELASAFGTLELKSGSNKVAKKLFKISLKDPTENSLAQAIFLQQKKIIKVEETRINIHLNFECKARSYLENEEFEKAFEQIQKWLSYQPFSSRTAVQGSYIASVVLGKFEKAIEMLKIGKTSSPKDFLLNNNLAFSLASLDRISDAKSTLKKINKENLAETEYEKNILKATRGLINFRDGEIETGRNLYKEAIKFFQHKKQNKEEAIATLFLAKEEALAKTNMSKKMKEHAISLVKKHGFKDLILASKQIT